MCFSFHLEHPEVIPTNVVPDKPVIETSVLLRDLVVLELPMDSPNKIIAHLASALRTITLGGPRGKHVQRSVLFEVTEHVVSFRCLRSKFSLKGRPGPSFTWVTPLAGITRQDAPRVFGES